jgi:glycosyltransferase involved in cell wall biosynthesis
MIALDVIIPYYGDPGYLLRAIESVRGLIDTEWRVLVVEDCYPDGPAVERRIKELGDDRISYVRNERNLGVAGNQHVAMASAEADYFVKLDADDLLLPNYGVQIAEMLRHYPDAAMLHPEVEVVDEDDAQHRPLPDRLKRLLRPGGGPRVLAGEPLAASLMRGNWLYTPALCYRRDISRDLTLRAGSDAVNDLSMVVDILLRGGSLALGEEVAFRYRRHRQSHSSAVAKTGLRFEQERAFFEAVEREFSVRGWPAAAAAARRRTFSRLNALTQVPGALSTRQRGALRSLLVHAFR